MFERLEKKKFETKILGKRLYTSILNVHDIPLVSFRNMSSSLALKDIETFEVIRTCLERLDY